MATLTSVVCLGAIATSSVAAEFDYDIEVNAPHSVVKLDGFAPPPGDEGKFKHTFTNTGDETDTYRMVISYAEYHSAQAFDGLEGLSWTMCTTNLCVAPGIEDQITLAPAQSDTVTVKIIPYTTTGSSRITLTFESLGSGEVSTFDYAMVCEGTPVVVIDDDGGDEYEDYVAAALADAGVEYGIYPTELESLTDADVDLVDADYLVVLTGDAATSTITAGDAAYYADYLDAAGKMLFSGQDLLDDITGSAFATTYLGATRTGSAAGQTDVSAEPGGPFDGAALDFSIAGGAGNQVSQDVVGGTAALRYDGGDVAGVYVDAAYRTVTLGFGLEGMAMSDMQELLARAATWFDGLLATDDAFDAVRPQVILASASPNPFRTSARLLLDVPASHRAEVNVRLFDTAGREVAVLHDGPLASSVRSLPIVGRDMAGRLLPNGVYHYRVTAGTAITGGSVTLVR
jgi:hypothetical protein